MTELKLGSLFDGIGGFPLAATMNDIRPVWASEIEPFPMAVTAYRFPQMKHMGDITKLHGANLPVVDVIAGGSPCQDLSVAGKREGLAGERSGLFMEQVRIVKEMRKQDRRRMRNHRRRTDEFIRPRYMLWENVPGAFSSGETHGADFHTVLEEVCRIKEADVSIPGPPGGAWTPAGLIMGEGFSVAWRVLDAQFWGVPQRRNRIFLVADFGGHTAPQILFEQDRLFGDSSESQSAGQGTAGTASQGTDHTGGTCLTPWDVQSRRIFSEDTVWPALYGGEGGGHGYIQKKEQENAEQVLCLNDQGGERMDITEGFTATLRAGMSGHPPLVAEQTAVSGVVTKGNGDCFLTPDVHTSLTGGGGQAGQGYPCVLTAGFCGNASAEAGGIGYQSERSPTLKTGTAPSILCLNDQGESEMHLSEAVTGTLQEQEHGYQPLVLASGQGGAEIGTGICPTITEAAGTSGNNQPILFENHGIDSRYTGPHAVAPTMSARYGTGGNNVPLISDDPQSYCIAGNIIDREVQNGGNGLGCQPDISYTLTGMDRHAVFSRQRSDELVENEVVSTQSARQHKDATDLVCQPDIFGQSQYGAYAEGCTTLRASGGDHGGGSENLVAMSGENPAERRLIRRLTPLECERLQGFPDGWTDMPGASDSARYKALGNSVAIPCVDFVLRGIAYFLCRNQEE